LGPVAPEGEQRSRHAIGCPVQIAVRQGLIVRLDSKPIGVPAHARVKPVRNGLLDVLLLEPREGTGRMHAPGPYGLLPGRWLSQGAGHAAHRSLPSSPGPIRNATGGEQNPITGGAPSGDCAGALAWSSRVEDRGPTRLGLTVLLVATVAAWRHCSS